MSYNADDVQACMAILRALWKDINAGNITLGSTVPNLNAATTAARLRTLADRVSEGMSSGCVRPGASRQGMLHSGQHTDL